MTLVWFLLVIVGGYLIGSLNYSIIYSRVFMNTDVRKRGSGNAGSTNMMRTYGWKAGVITLCTDFLKAFLVTLGAWAIFVINCPDWTQSGVAAAGLSCAIGHCFPAFFGFRGGKGVAVGAIMSLMVDWRCFLVIIATFLVFVAITRYVSLGSMCGALAFPISLAFFIDLSSVQNIITFGCACCVAALIIVLHRKNIQRLFKGTESKITFKK